LIAYAERKFATFEARSTDRDRLHLLLGSLGSSDGIRLPLVL
jgi:hypothetical protein